MMRKWGVLPIAIEVFLYVVLPLVQLLAWWSVHKHNKEVQKKLFGMDTRVNGRLDELIAVKEQLAYERGKKEGIAEALLLRGAK